MAQEQQGPLMKACQRMCVVAWQVRFFVLRGCSLLYYSDSSCTSLKGDIRLDSTGASVTKVGELVLFLENVRNACKAGSSKSAFRLKAQSSRESTAWALALDAAISQSAVARIPVTNPFPPVTDNIFDKYKQTEVHRHNQQSQIHSAVSAKSGNESTASSAVQSQQGHAVAAKLKAVSDSPLDLSVQSAAPSPQEVACALLSAAFARCLWQSGYHIDYVAADIVRFALKHHRNIRLQQQQAAGNYSIPTWRHLKAAKVLRAVVQRMLWQQAYHIDYLAADIIRYFWRSRRRHIIENTGESYPGEIASSDVDASVYESHVSFVSHASSLHSTAQSIAVLTADTRHDFEFTFPQQARLSDAAYVIAAAAGRMLWQQAYQVDRLASSIISQFWRSKQRRRNVNIVPARLVQHGSSEWDDTRPVHANTGVLLAKDAILILHASMARAVWRQGFVIDRIAASIIAHNWRKLKQKRDTIPHELNVATLSPANSLHGASSQFLASDTGLKDEDKACAIAAIRQEASELMLQCTSEDAAPSLRPAVGPSFASRKAFGALLRSSRTGELGELLRSFPGNSHSAALTSDAQILAIREKLIVTSLTSVIGDSESLPHEIVVELLLQSGIFMPSAATVMAEQLKAPIPFSLRQ